MVRLPCYVASMHSSCCAPTCLVGCLAPYGYCMPAGLLMLGHMSICLVFLHCLQVRFEPREVLVRQGDTADCIYVLKSGQVGAAEAYAMPMYLYVVLTGCHITDQGYGQSHQSINLQVHTHQQLAATCIEHCQYC